MTAEQQLQVRLLFEQALEADPSSLDQWLDRASSDAVVRAEVRSLLRHHSMAGAFLVAPVLDSAPMLGDDDGSMLPGTTVGPYTIVREIGRGGMGRVFLASDQRLGRSVAIKAVAPRFTRDPAQRERLRREARAAGSLSHPGICAVYALEEFDGQLFIVTEYIEGRTLREEIDDGARPDADLVNETARELAAALGSAHARGIVHRDFNPANVMRTSDGRLKILDFGLARQADVVSTAVAPESVTTPGMLVGTPAYMAPEQLNGGQTDRRADVFAFGVLIYEYATGRHPFEASTPLAMMARVLEAEPMGLETLRSDLRPALVQVVRTCLRKNPADRFASAVEIEASIAAATPAPPSRRWWSLHQAAVVSMYAVGATVAWQLKEWHPDAVTRSAFVAAGVLATIGATLRGHLLFTNGIHPAQLTVERRRTQRLRLATDLLLAAALVADGVATVQVRPLAGVLTMSLGVGIALAAVLIEPSTAAAAFDTRDVPS